MGTRTGTFYKEAEDSEEVAALFDAVSDASGDMETLDCIRYVGGTGFCIDHLQHTEAEMGAFEEDGAQLITVMMPMQAFRTDCIGAHRLIIECCVPAGIHMVMVVRH